MSFRPTSSRGPGRVPAVGMHDVSQATIKEAVEDENVFAFVPPSTAEQQARNTARETPSYTSRYKAILDILRPLLPPSRRRNSVTAVSGDNAAPISSNTDFPPNLPTPDRGAPTLKTTPDTANSYANHPPSSFHNMNVNAYRLQKSKGRVSTPDTAHTLGDGLNLAMHETKKSYTMTPPSSVENKLATLEDNKSVKMEYDLEAVEEEDSPYPEVRASVSNIDDPTMPANTLRMWVIALFVSMITGSINVFFFFRSTAPHIAPVVVQLISHPIGKFLAYALPIQTYRIPLPKPFSPITFSLNPGPWTIKEHGLVYIMSNAAIGAPYALDVIGSLRYFYGLENGYWFDVLLVLSTQITGFGLAGICRKLFIWPASMIWPNTLVACTLFNTLHAEVDEGKGQLTRWKMFLIIAVSSFFFFFLPGYLFQALSLFSFICWIVPNNVVVNQLFGSASGLGMNILTFDWTEISWIGSPLVTPWWAQLHFFGGFVLFYWILLPILYYTNVWQLSHFPISGTRPYDRFGQLYNTSRILTHDLRFNRTAYEAYSPLYLPGTYAMTYLLAFGAMSCLLVHTALYHGQTMWRALTARVEEDDIHSKLMRSYSEVPSWWYVVMPLIFFTVAIISMEVWRTTLPVWGLVLSVAIPVVFLIPGSFVNAMTGFIVDVNLQIQIIIARALPGNPTANMLAKAYAVGINSGAQGFIQDLKLGHYLKLPPRATFMVQVMGTFIVSIVQIGVTHWLFGNVKNICTSHAQNHLTCPRIQVYFTASTFWGLIGPDRQFGRHALYYDQLWALLIGAFLPIPLWLWTRWHPNSFFRYISTPLILIGCGAIPPATGINFSSWFLVGFFFQYLLRNRNFLAWSKYNYIISAGLDSGTTFSIFVIFFALQYPKNGINLSWWGNDVFTTTADYLRTPYRPINPHSPLPWPS